MSTVNQVSLNIDELKGFVTHIVNNNRYLQEQGKNSVSVEVIGESGIGKTSSVLQLANELGLNFVKLNLAQIEELGDLVGFPIRQFQLCKGEASAPVMVVSGPVTKKVKVKKQVPKEVTTMEKQQVQEFDIKVTKKQVLKGGRFVSEDVETKVPRMVEKEVPVTITVMEEVEIEEEVVDKTTTQMQQADSEIGECLWIDEHAVEEYTKRGFNFTGKKRMSYCPPEWIADKQGGGLLILDDWNRAD